MLLLVGGLSVAAHAQSQAPPVPKPFPQPGQSSQTPPATAPAQPAAKPAAASPEAPTEATLGVPVYPKAEFLASYDAGQGQRYYLFGTNATFGEVVAYYKGVLNNKGELVFEEPPVHMFDIAKFKEETMAFPPSVTVKDYTWGGMKGYLNPKGTQAQLYKTVIQIVPPPSGAQ